MEITADEELDIDPKLIDKAFKNCLKIKYFLKDLKNLALDDSLLIDKKFQIEKAFQSFEKNYDSLTSYSKAQVSLSDFRQFGLDKKTIDRLGILTFDYDRYSPKQASRSVPLQRNVSIQSEYEYDDDFEEIEEDIDVPEIRSNTNKNFNKGIGLIDPKTISSSSTEFRKPPSFRANIPERNISTSSGDSSNKKRQKTPTWITSHSWRLGEKIGSGSFGEVFQGLNDKVSIS